MLFRVGDPHANKAVRRTPRPAMRAASNQGQFNKNAQSNQQDLIDEIEANRRQKPARGEGVLPGASANQRQVGSEQHGNNNLRMLNERMAVWAA